MFRGGGKIDIEERDFGARGGERLCRGGADGAGGAGDADDLPGERRLYPRTELLLFERPILAVEHVGLGDRLEAADRFGVGDDCDPFLGDVSGDHGVALRPTKPEQAEPAHQHDAGQGIELLLDAADAFVVALEIMPIVRGECVRRFAGRARKIIELADLRMRQHERPVLGADGVVRQLPRHFHSGGLSLCYRAN